MANLRSRAKISRWHRRFGLMLSVPLLSWIVSAFFLHYYGLVMPNGLQGVYRLQPYNSVAIDLGTAPVQPNEILEKLRTEYGLDKIYWLRLEAHGEYLWYTVKPSPFVEGMVFDANSAERVDPLSDALLEVVADESLAGTKAVALRPAAEYHRDYAASTIPAVDVTMAGEQPANLVLSRATGRTLRRSDSQAQGFSWWYKSFHVLQWGDSMAFFTIVLYLFAAAVVVLAFFGLRLWWWRRGRPKQIYRKPGMQTRAWHRKLGLVVGTLVLVQMLLGIYMWLSLGPLQDPFRGKNSFAPAWRGGVPTSSFLADAQTVLARIPSQTNGTGQPVQAIQWRERNGKLVWQIQMRKDELGRIYDANSGEMLGDLAPEEAGRAAQQLMAGLPAFEYRGETTYYNNDLHRKLPAYHYRFADAAATDVFVSKTTGAIISRRPRFWRAFSPFLMFHALAFTENKIIDTIVLSVFQVGLLGLILTGWLMNFRSKRN